MRSLWEILRSVAPAVVGLVAIVVIGLSMQRSIGRVPSVFPVSTPEQEEPGS